MAEIDVPPVVVDSGTGAFKVGIAGNTDPLVFPPIIGRPKNPSYQTWAWLFGCGYRDKYVGDEAQCNRGILSLNFPIQRGAITNWDDYENLWHHIYRDLLLIPSDERPLLLTEAPFNTFAQRETMAQILFEKLQVPALGLTLSAMLSMYALGCSTGIVLDCGEGLTYTLPVFEGTAIPKAILRHPNLAGGDLTDYLQKLLTKKHPAFGSKADRSTFREIKEKHCYVAPYLRKKGFKNDVFGPLERSAVLPDGARVNFIDERYMCPEALFQPSLLGIECLGVHQGLYNSILKCPTSRQQRVSKTVVLCGGTTQLPGMEDRIRKELLALSPSWDIPTVIAAPNRPQSAWLGGSVLATMSNFTNLCISKSDYEEQGPRTIHQIMGPI